MEEAHFFALIPLLIFLILSLIFRRVGLLHIMTLAYTMILAFIAVTNTWELIFFAPLVGTGIISLILFGLAMTKGEWL